MGRAVVILIELGVAIVVALAILSTGLGLAEAARQLFLFMDVGLGVWLALLIVGAVRQRSIGYGFWGTIVAAVIGALANLATVIVVGFIQTGWAAEFVQYALIAGAAFLVGAVVAAFVARAIVKATAAGGSRT